MMDYQERVVQEKKDLDEKSARLYDFINRNDKFKELDSHEQFLLRNQYYLMRHYSWALATRLDYWGIK